MPHTQNLISKLHDQFALKQLGHLDYFFGIEVSHLSYGSLFLSQTKYLRDLLARTNMNEAKGLPTPMGSNLRLTKDGSDYLQDPTYYMSVVGALQYVTITRPEISFAVNKACKLLAQPLESHWIAVKRILRYLRGTLHHGFHLLPSAPDKPIARAVF